MERYEPLDSWASDPMRTFHLWRYSVSHSQLLIRSTQDERFTTRIDVLFKGVRHLDLPASMTAIEIEAAPPSDAGGRAYKVRFLGGEGSVVAGAAFVAEDDAEYDEASAFDV